MSSSPCIAFTSARLGGSSQFNFLQNVLFIIHLLISCFLLSTPPSCPFTISWGCHTPPSSVHCWQLFLLPLLGHWWTDAYHFSYYFSLPCLSVCILLWLSPLLSLTWRLPMCSLTSIFLPLWPRALSSLIHSLLFPSCTPGFHSQILCKALNLVFNSMANLRLMSGIFSLLFRTF